MPARDDLIETCPPVCECCGARRPGSTRAARADGWQLGWDGWVCATCDASAELSPRIGEALRDALHGVYHRAADDAAERC